MFAIGLAQKESTGSPDLPESITLPKLPELDGDDAGERGSDETSLQWPLAHASREEVNVVHGWVNPLQSRKKNKVNGK